MLSGLSTMCPQGTPNANSPDTNSTDDYVVDPRSLSDAQTVGDACAICHARWPRPRSPLGILPDGTRVYGCGECAGIIAAYSTRAAAVQTTRSENPALAAY